MTSIPDSFTWEYPTPGEAFQGGWPCHIQLCTNVAYPAEANVMVIFLHDVMLLSLDNELFYCKNNPLN